ncbi:hypothetical protein MKK67_06155 [Methylobacterium sp. J-072]|uniref:hypothetical protein n=1 Tax=Methylobacterium sp. J-072 TaxID=2836651 RepID=UPI001FBB0801|nr:hypothetical protein [Methylobacterium sp. J-072]MCJ2092083.1 hypothetical protein [Methylobacterium sp. J-072]
MFLYSSSEDDDSDIINFVIKEEQDLWDLIRLLSDDETSLIRLNIEIKNLSWAKLQVIYDGDIFKQSLTADAMRGLIDFQTSFYKSIALLLKGTRKASSLTEEEKSVFRLNYKVGPGSSDVEAKGDDKLPEILGRIAEKMESKHLLWLACFGFALYFGKGGLEVYLNHTADMKKIEQQGESEKGLQDIIRDMNQSQKENIKLISELSKKSDAARELTTGSIEAHESIVRHSAGTDKITINGQEISAKAVRELTNSQRKTGSNQVFEGVYSIESVDPSDPTQYMIKLRNLSDGDIFQAKLADAIVMEEFKSVIKDAEWDRSRVLLKISARRVGHALKNAEIISARRIAPD